MNPPVNEPLYDRRKPEGILIPKVLVIGVVTALIISTPASIFAGALVWQHQSDVIASSQAKIEELKKSIDDLKEQNRHRDEVVDRRIDDIGKYQGSLHDETEKLRSIVANLTERLNGTQGAGSANR